MPAALASNAHRFERVSPAWYDRSTWRNARRAAIAARGLAAEQAADARSARPAAIAEAARSSRAAEIVALCESLGERSGRMADEMNFGFLYKEDRHLFSIGLNMATGRLDASCYDLMASEACLSSFLAVARGDAPRRHWFQLGRPFIEAADRIGLLSWGGSCFEYLMPRLMMLPLKGTLLDQAHRTAVARQMEYGRQMGVPWGISESAYAAFSVDGDYHYQSFGTPGLGLKRDIGTDLVIAPYATALAVAVEPRAALENFRKLAAEGGEGRYGFHEAVDFTPERVPKGKRSVVVREYMAHHHGMSLVALANALLDEPMPRRFHAEPMIRAVDLLLQERVPRDAPIVEPSESEPTSQTAEGKAERAARAPDEPAPEHADLAGAPDAPAVELAVQRDADQRRVGVERLPGARRDPVAGRLDARQHRAVHLHPRRDDQRRLVGRAPADLPAGRPLRGDLLGRQGRLPPPRRRDRVPDRDHGLARGPRRDPPGHPDQPRHPPPRARADQLRRGRPAQPRRPTPATRRSASCSSKPSGPRPPRRCSVAAAPGRPTSTRSGRSTSRPPTAPSPRQPAGPPQFETDRARFLGRGRTTAAPAALDPGATLSGTVGAVLDPILSIRRRVRIEPGMAATVAFTTAVADSRDEALTLADHYREIAAVARAFELAWAHSQVEHRSRNWSAQDAHTYQRLGSSLLYAGTALRADPAILPANRKGQPGLWAYGISGDKPIILAFIADFDQTGLVAQLLTAHTYLRLKGLEADLVFLTGPADGDLDDLPGLVLDLVRGSDARDLIDQRGGIYVRKLAPIPEDDRVLLQSYARVVLHGDGGSLANQLDRPERVHPLPDPFVADRRAELPRGRVDRPRPRNSCSTTGPAASPPMVAST